MLPELKPQPLRYVLTVIDEGGFRNAARKLHRTQPALSMAVRDLEEKLGQRLFEKSNKGTLTPFGEYCVPRFRDLLNQHDRLAQDLLAQAEGRAGRVNLATVPSVASRLMPEFLATFIAQHPGLDINLHDENAEFVCRMVATGEVDLGISSLWGPDERLAYTHLFEDNVGVVCRQDHWLAARKTLSWQDLGGERFISNGTSRLLENSAAASLLDNQAFYISNMISLIAMLEAGGGITTLPRLAFPENSQYLKFIPLHDPHLVRGIGVIKATDRSPSPASSALESMILERLQGWTIDH